jgi:beta-1,4-N-acetylglucosaminyltransferase
MLSQSSTSTRARKTVFVTVGSTRFDDLITIISTPSFIEIIATLGYTHLKLQYGHSVPPSTLRHGDSVEVNTTVAGVKKMVDVSGFKFKDSIDEDMKEAALIISHAGNRAVP